MIKSSKDALRDTVFRSATIFEDFGFVYLGPVDGHNLEDLEEVLQAAKAYECPVFIFTRKKGKAICHLKKTRANFMESLASMWKLEIRKFPERIPIPIFSGKNWFALQRKMLQFVRLPQPWNTEPGCNIFPEPIRSGIMMSALRNSMRLRLQLHWHRRESYLFLQCIPLSCSVPMTSCCMMLRLESSTLS